ncbi:MAG TPA: cell envelope biogenesis protein OmpA, partial [Halieaceae bacterium]|nr:cell envelope biogenesis protein OmpA [Halieaceae bacterium]
FLDFEQNVLPVGGSRNSQEGDSFSKIDLRISQEVPGFAPGHRGSAFIIIDNLTNLLNDDWGVMNQPSFPYGVTAEQEANGQAQQRIGDTSLWSMRVGLSYRF